MAARRIMTGRHNEGEEKEKEKERGGRARKMPGEVVVVVVVQGTPGAQCDKTVRRLSPCGRAGTLHKPRNGLAWRTRSPAVAALPDACQTQTTSPSPD